MQLIVNAIGTDRPGIVGELTGHLHAGGANILDSRMVNLRGQFAIITLIEADDANAAALKSTLPQIAQRIGLQLTLVEQSASAPAPHGLPFRLKTYSMDQPGIVHRITEVLRTRGVNIEELSARQESAAFAGSQLFIMELRITIPAATPLKSLRADLESVCDKLNCELDLEPA